MATVIKSEDSAGAGRHVAFNFDDMAQQADTYLKGIRQQAAKLVAQAHEEANQIRKQAEEAGRQEAEQQQQKIIEKKVAEQAHTLLPAIQQAIHDVTQTKHAWMAHWEQQAVRVSVAIARRVIRRELQKQPDIPVGLIREALQLASGGGAIRVLIHPDDHRNLGTEIDTMIAEMERLATTTLVSDPHIQAGGCRIETQYGAIDQQIELQLSRIEQELT